MKPLFAPPIITTTSRNHGLSIGDRVLIADRFMKITGIHRCFLEARPWRWYDTVARWAKGLLE